MILLGLLFVVSGLAGLMLETVFLRQLARLFGNSTSATVAVLAAFMAGLALGAALLARTIHEASAEAVEMPPAWAFSKNPDLDVLSCTPSAENLRRDPT